MINPNAPAIDHNSVYSIYDRVVRNLPFLLSDSIIGTSPIVGFDLTANTITISGDMGGSTPTTVQTPTSLYGVVSINYDSNTDTTVIEVSDINVPIPNGALLSYLIVLDATEQVNMISGMTFDVMHELNVCLKHPVEEIGQEQYYSVTEQVLISCIVSIYLLMIQAISNMEGTAGSSTTSATLPSNVVRWLKRAKAGEVETEWGVIDTTSSSTSTTSPILLSTYDNLVNQLYKRACMILKQFGCKLTICCDCTCQVEPINYIDQSFKVYTTKMPTKCNC